MSGRWKHKSITYQIMAKCHVFHPGNAKNWKDALLVKEHGNSSAEYKVIEKTQFLKQFTPVDPKHAQEVIDFCQDNGQTSVDESEANDASGT